VKRQWSPEELIEHFSLLPQEHSLLLAAIANVVPHNQLGFAVLLKFFQVEARFPEMRKQLWGGEFWSDGGYIGTVGDGVNSEIVRRYIREQGTEEEKARAKQLKLFSLS